MRQVSLLILLLFVSVQLSAVETYAYAQKDTSTLYLDIHRPTAGSETALNGVQKPTILYLFGGYFTFCLSRGSRLGMEQSGVAGTTRFS